MGKRGLYEPKISLVDGTRHGLAAPVAGGRRRRNERRNARRRGGGRKRERRPGAGRALRPVRKQSIPDAFRKRIIAERKLPGRALRALRPCAGKSPAGQRGRRPVYEASYFEKRTDRGYDNYFSGELKQQIRRVYEQNLDDLGFFDYEEACLGDAWFLQHCEEQAGAETEHRDYRPRALDAGCAAGYFVEFLQDRGWNSQGVELSRAAAKFGIDELGLNILIADFLTSKRLPKESYDLLTFWASIEHMHSPRGVFERCRELLKPGGRLILSTCRYGLLARWRGEDWRFMNVPEHLFFFSLNGIRKMAEDCGFRTVASVTYGSGFTTKKDASLFYKAAKAVADPLVKRTDQGDMMALHFVKV